VSTTPNLLLKKPETTDPALIGDLNDNADVLDALWAPITPSTASITQSGAVGSNTSVARSDHSHEGAGFAAPVATGAANAEGDAATASRSNHVHRAPTAFYNHVEDVILDPALAETVEFYVPAALSWAKLTLRGRTPRAGVLASHQHGGALTSTSTAHAHTGSNSNETADHGHSGTTANESALHAHSGTSAGASVDHAHSFTSSGASVGHTHSLSSDGTHAHNLQWVPVTSQIALATTSSGSIQNDATYISSAGSQSHGGSTGGHSTTHTHTLTTGTESANHGHTFSTGGVSANHSHTLTIDSSGGHTHSTTVQAEGAGGTQTFSRPQGVTVSINGVDRTVALSGPFGAATDWDSVDMDILTYVTAEAWNEIEVTSTSVGRLKVHVTGVFS
jgi:hypothetical protein